MGSTQASNGEFQDAGKPIIQAVYLNDPSNGAPLGSAANPFNVGGSVTASNPSVGTDGATAPGSSTQVGGQTVGGNLVALFVDSAGRLYVNVTSLPAISGTVAVSNFPATQPVSGTFWQATQPISAASLPLPTGAALETGGNLATLAGIVSSSKAAVKAASGDFVAGSIVDLATLAAAVASGKVQI